MPRRPEIGNIQLYPDRPLRESDRNGYVLKFYCPIEGKRVRKNCGTRDGREARRILRECRERLLNGGYIESGGAITSAHEIPLTGQSHRGHRPAGREGRTWQECVDHYYEHQKLRIRDKSLTDAMSRVAIAGRILEGYREESSLPEDASIRDDTTLGAMEYVQDRLLAGDEGLFDYRSPTTVNTMMGAVMAFVRYCHVHEWIDRVPPIAKLDVEDVMKGRPVAEQEFGTMLKAVPSVVGKRSAASWEYVLQILWESAFRIGDVMNFSWDDERRIYPIWSRRSDELPTLAIPSSQKNKKAQLIPMLPGLEVLLQKTPKKERQGWVVNPLPVDYQVRTENDWFKPTPKDLEILATEFGNSAIGRACGVSETTVRVWIKGAGIDCNAIDRKRSAEVPLDLVNRVRQSAQRLLSRPAVHTDRRLTKERVSRVISMIGKEAGVIVQQPNEETGRRLKYASAHDLRRGCAQRLINAGVSAETLKVVMRHKDFATTERFYGATRAAQSAAAEIHERLAASDKKTSLVGGLVGGLDARPQLSPAEIAKLKALLNSL